VLYGFVLENPMKNILVFMKIFTKCFVWCFWYYKWFKILELCGLAFTLKTCLKMVTGRLRPVIKLVLGFGFDFGNEKPNNLHSKQPTYFRKCNALLRKRFLGTNTMRM
jgi:hypothetical protein